MTKLLTDIELPVGLRIADLVAKTARVSLKDTLRVLAILDAVSYFMDTDPVDIIEMCTYDPTRPNTDNIAACERAFFDLKTKAKVDPQIQKLLALSRSMQ